MNIIYQRIKELCAERGTTYSAVCKELGMHPSVIGNLSSDEERNLTSDKAIAFARYFKVPVGYILGIEDKPVTDAETPISDEDIKFALFDGDRDITDEMFAEVKKFAAYVKAREREKDAGTF